MYYSRLALRSIFQNILSNSFKYISLDREPKVEITIDSTKKQHVIEIKDNGLGMDLKKHENKLFGLFQRINQRESGSGMGMFIVKNLLHNYGGELKVQSALDVGTTFEIILPNSDQ